MPPVEIYMLRPESCDVFNRTFFQFAQMKKYAPDSVEAVKAEYKAAWAVWRDVVMQVYGRLGAEFAEPHIEHWCNGWQVRAHFFAYFKYHRYRQSAAIFSLLLNRRRLTVALDWHAYRAAQSVIGLADYHRWTEALPEDGLPGFEVWLGSDSEYDDHLNSSALFAWKEEVLAGGKDFFRIGCHVGRDDLAHTDAVGRIVSAVRLLQPLYEACHEGWQSNGK